MKIVKFCGNLRFICENVICIFWLCLSVVFAFSACNKIEEIKKQATDSLLILFNCKKMCHDELPFLWLPSRRARDLVARIFSSPGYRLCLPWMSRFLDVCLEICVRLLLFFCLFFVLGLGFSQCHFSVASFNEFLLCQMEIFVYTLKKCCLQLGYDEKYSCCLSNIIIIPCAVLWYRVSARVSDSNTRKENR